MLRRQTLHSVLFATLVFATIVLFRLANADSALAQSKISGDSSPEKARQELLDLENHWLQKEHDPDALELILAPDFLHVLSSGIITKQEHIDYWRKHPAPAGESEHRASKHFEEMHVRVYGTVGIVNGMVVADEPSGVRRTLFTDVFAYRDSKWQAVSAQELPVPEKPR